ncbi:DUF5412 family protein [Virgibacillus halodenitrificans]|uniref:Uncharacterized protein n=1 Tax=Virgibacillus halodenitrificans TaxID=1482 RepID=A0ABR7VJP6_VIRHA|nr:DUF5412 family protein [Virgibacillus halodenitrificans]MBD1222147.1 hypothetical protein [Virgibacillus halodenitrificans]
MNKHYNLGSFYLLLALAALAGYAFYSNIHHMWLVAPPNYILFLGSLCILVLAIKGLKYKESRLARIRSWVTVTFSSLLSIALLFAVIVTFFASTMGASVHIKTASSPDENYTLEFYRWNAGAAGSLGIRGEINGPLWTKKRFYYQVNKEDVNITWEDANTVTINNHTLQLDEGETYGY